MIESWDFPNLDYNELLQKHIHGSTIKNIFMTAGSTIKNRKTMRYKHILNIIYLQVLPSRNCIAKV